MSAKMPEPVAWISTVKCVGPEYGKERFGKLPIQSLMQGYYEHTALITTTQAEAYAAAVRREALDALDDYVSRYSTGGNPGTDRPRWAKDLSAHIRALIEKEKV